MSPRLCRSDSEVSWSALPVCCCDGADSSVWLHLQTSWTDLQNPLFSVDLCDFIWCVNVEQKGWINLFVFCSFQYRCKTVCDTYDELRGDDSIHDGTEERRDDPDTDEYDRCRELKRGKV